MGFTEAKAIASKEAKAGTEEVRTDPRAYAPHTRRIESWRGLKFFQNVGTEDTFSKYLPDIETGKLVVGPAFWIGPKDEIKISDGVVGLFHSR